MRLSLFTTLLLAPLAALANGAIVVQPQPNGSLRLFSEGQHSGGRSGSLSLLQPANKTVILQLQPAGDGRCENNELVAASLALSIHSSSPDTPLRCGQPLQLAASPRDRWIHFHANAFSRVRGSALMRQGLSPRVQLGSFSFSVEGENSILTPLYLDLHVLQKTASTVSASFDKSALIFGEVGPFKDTKSSVRLRLTKTDMANAEPLSYKLSFESIQQQHNEWRLRSTPGEDFVPYKITVADVTIAPDGIYRGILPAGEVSSAQLEVQFILLGKEIRGIPAGTRLHDTLTAIITPES